MLSASLNKIFLSLYLVHSQVLGGAATVPDVDGTVAGDVEAVAAAVVDVAAVLDVAAAAAAGRDDVEDDPGAGGRGGGGPRVEDVLWRALPVELRLARVGV